jgi:hypothetical protein
MAYATQFSTNQIDLYTKITNDSDLIPGKKYLVRYSYIKKPRCYYIASFRNIAPEDGELTYFFDVLYFKRTPGVNWLTFNDHEFPTIGMSLDVSKRELFIKEDTVNKEINPLELKSGFDFSFFELGEYGNMISELLRPQHVLSNLRALTRQYIAPKTNDDVTNLIIGFRDKTGGRKTRKRNISKHRKTKKNRRKTL